MILSPTRTTRTAPLFPYPTLFRSGLAELARLDQLAEVLVGGREDAHVVLDFVAAADRAHGFFLDRPQQFHLHVQRQFGHLVEEQRAALGGLEQAFLVGAGAGEAALAVADRKSVV